MRRSRSRLLHRQAVEYRHHRTTSVTIIDDDFGNVYLTSSAVSVAEANAVPPWSPISHRIGDGQCDPVAFKARQLAAPTTHLDRPRFRSLLGSTSAKRFVHNDSRCSTKTPNGCCRYCVHHHCRLIHGVNVIGVVVHDRGRRSNAYVTVSASATTISENAGYRVFPGNALCGIGRARPQR